MTLNDILLASSAYLDLEVTLPVGTEYDTRVLFANQAVREWAQSYSWRQLKIETTQISDYAASLGLPGYNKLASPPMKSETSDTYTAYPEITPEDRWAKGADDEYCYITGDPIKGYAAHFNALATGSTITIQYYRDPSCMATNTDVCEVPDPQFVTQRVISYVLQSRNDERFPVVQAEGNRLLRNMIAPEMQRTPGGANQTRKIGTSAYSLGS
jgi:hypothetical protein